MQVDQVLPGDKGIKDVAPDLVEGSSEKIPQRSAPSYGTQSEWTCQYLIVGLVPCKKNQRLSHD
jgi:hypothetical protein